MAFASPAIRSLISVCNLRKATLALALLAVTAVPAGALAAPTSLTPFYQQLQQAAIHRSPELKIAEEVAAQSQAHEWTAWSAWLPHVDASLAQSRSRDYSLLTSGSLGALAGLFVPADTPITRWALTLTVPIYRRSVHVGVEIAQAQSELAQLQARSKLAEMDWRLHSLFGGYLLQLYRQATLQTSIERSRTSLREAKLRFELGQRTKVDVLRAQANLQTLESRQLTTQQEQESALNAFLEYSGLERADLESADFRAAQANEAGIEAALNEYNGEPNDHGEPIGGSDGASHSSGAAGLPIQDLEGEGALDLGQSPTARMTELQEQVDHHQAKSFMALEWPDLSLQGSLNKQSPDWDHTFRPSEISRSVGVVLTIPLFSGGSLFSTSAEERHAQAAAALREQLDLRKFAHDFENDRARLRSLSKSVQSYRTLVEQNDELVRLSFKSYQLGKATVFELLSAQNDLIDSKVSYAQAKTDRAVLLRKLAWNLGVTRL